MKEMTSEDILSTKYLGNDKPENAMKPVVSVCVITYNHAPFIAECLDSVLMQETDFPFEVIIGEDNSTDGTREICKDYEARNPDRIRLFLREDKDKLFVNNIKTGGFNFYSSISDSNGEFIALLEGDDFWIDRYKLQKQLDFIKQNNLDVCYTNNFMGSSLNNSKPRNKPNFIKGSIVTHANIPNSLEYKIKPFLIGHTSTLVFKSSIVLNPVFIQKYISLDIAFFHQFLDEDKRIGYLDEITSFYRIVGKGITKKIKNEDTSENFVIDMLQDMMIQFPKSHSIFYWNAKKRLYNKLLKQKRGKELLLLSSEIILKGKIRFGLSAIKNGLLFLKN